jgi:endo-1,4-beta-mannosidase
MTHTTTRWLFVLVLLALLPACNAPPQTDGRMLPVTARDGRLFAGGRELEIRGVNYVHPTGADLATCGMLQFGADANCPWEMAPIEQDFERLQELGVNTVRVFLNYYVFGGARASQPAYDMTPALQHLESFVAAANTRGIYVIPVLMAKYPQETFGAAYYKRTLTLHVQPVVSHFAGNPGILMWDLFNEPDIGSPVDIRCWDWDNALEPGCFPMAEERMRFLQVVHDEVKRLDPDRLTTISVAFAKSYFEPKEAFMRLADLVDVLTFHYYDDEPSNSGRYKQHWYYGQGFPADLQRAIRELRELQSGKPILVTEIGFPTGPDDWRRQPELRREFAAARKVVREEQAAGMLLWPFQPSPDELVGDTFK